MDAAEFLLLTSPAQSFERENDERWSHIETVWATLGLQLFVIEGRRSCMRLQQPAVKN